jgi:uncharacterized protein
VSEAALAQIVDFIVRSLSPQSVTLFGSLAHGRAEPSSDIDLVVIGEFREPRWLRGRELRVLCEQYAMPIDVQCYTPSEFEREAAVPSSFAAMVERHGRRLHENGPAKERASREFTPEALSETQKSFYAETCAIPANSPSNTSTLSTSEKPERSTVRGSVQAGA